jgi:hypothetical protein
LFLHGANYIVLGNGTTTTGNVPAPQTGMNVHVTTITTGGVIIQLGGSSTIAGYFSSDDPGKTVKTAGENILIE